MRKIWILISLIIVFIVSCEKITYVERICYGSHDWTSDGKVIFLKVKETWEVDKDNDLIRELVCDSTWLHEINSDGTGTENKGLLLTDGQVYGLSTAGDWVVFADEDYNIWVVRKNGSGLQRVGEGTDPDLSHDATRIVYEKRNQGIWIMDRDGGNDHQIISGTLPWDPQWSPDDTLIAYTTFGTHISNLNGDSVKFYSSFNLIDWGPIDSNLILCQTHVGGFTIVFNILSDSTVDTIDFIAEKWSTDGLHFIGHTSQHYYIIDRNGNNEVPICEICETN